MSIAAMLYNRMSGSPPVREQRSVRGGFLDGCFRASGRCFVCVCVCVWAVSEAATVLIDKKKTRFQNVNCRKARQ